ncbi:MAG: hypothetical protein WCI19_13735, partial [Betaproteobacteria bacterium]
EPSAVVTQVASASPVAANDPSASSARSTPAASSSSAPGTSSPATGSESKPTEKQEDKPVAKPVVTTVVIGNTTVQKPAEQVVQIERPKGRLLVCKAG